MGKKEKEHRKKVSKRNEVVKAQQKKLKKIQHDMLMQLIEKEKASGKFDNLPVTYGPIIDLGNGPMI